MVDAYSQEAIDFINAGYGAEIARQSALLGVSAGAVAGAMVKEYNSNISSPVQTFLQKSMDDIARSTMSFATATDLALYQRGFVSADMTPPKTVAEFALYYSYKRNNPYLVDAGPANIRIGKAISNVDYYFANYPGNPLGLPAEYRDNPTVVANALLAGDPRAVHFSRHDGRTVVMRVVPAVFGPKTSLPTMGKI